MRLIVTLVFLICYGSAAAQSADDAYDLYRRKEYSKALDAATRLLQSDSSASVCLLMGRVLADENRYDAAIPYLQRAIRLDNDASWISGWGHAYMGKALLLQGQKERALAELNKTVALHTTQNSVSFAQSLIANADNMAEVMPIINRMSSDTAGAANTLLKSKWITIEGKNITYNFRDTVGWGGRVDRYITIHEQAYENIDTVFHARMPRKLTFYIWNSPEDGRKALGKSLGFTNPEECICFVHKNQTPGHEMTHALSYWGWGEKPANRTRFINEGVAVAFDQDNEAMKMLKARMAVKDNHIGSVLDVWENDKRMEDRVLYPVAGAFVAYLYAHSDAAQFRSLLKDQTIEHARELYGRKRFKELIKEFDEVMKREN